MFVNGSVTYILTLLVEGQIKEPERIKLLPFVGFVPNESKFKLFIKEIVDIID